MALRRHRQSRAKWRGAALTAVASLVAAPASQKHCRRNGAQCVFIAGRPLRMAKVERQAALAAIGAQIICTLPRGKRTPGPGHVPALGRLDFYDRRTQVPKNHRGERAGKRTRQVEYANPLQWTLGARCNHERGHWLKSRDVLFAATRSGRRSKCFSPPPEWRHALPQPTTAHLRHRAQSCGCCA